MQPQINTLEDIYRSPFPILVTSKSFAEHLNDVLKNVSSKRDWIGVIKL